MKRLQKADNNGSSSEDESRFMMEDRAASWPKHLTVPEVPQEYALLGYIRSSLSVA